MSKREVEKQIWLGARVCLWAYWQSEIFMKDSALPTIKPGPVGLEATSESMETKIFMSPELSLERGAHFHPRAIKLPR